MAVTILSYLHNATTLLFGIYISAAFLGILMNRRNILTLLGFSVSIGIIYLVSYFNVFLTRCEGCHSEHYHWQESIFDIVYHIHIQFLVK